jgi:hypothetical protein
MTKQKLLVLLVLYILSAGGAFGVATFLGKGSAGQFVAEQPGSQEVGSEEEVETGKKLLTINPNEPKDQPCPLNGKMYTTTEKNAWEKRRPLAVMIENSPDARPQSGLGRADMVFEALAEGGVTRFMAMFYCDVQVEDIVVAPVRSARTYFIDWASGFNYPLYVHVGGANVPGPSNALGQLTDYGWTGQNDLNQFSIGYPTFVRDYNRVPGKELATEHTMVSSTEKLWAVGEKRKWTNLSPQRTVNKKTTGGIDWKEGFTPVVSADDAAAASTTAPSISFEFWDGFANYGVKWDYDKATNSYKRTMAGEPHTDLNDEKQISAKNAIVLFSEEKGPINEQKHMLYKTTGTGDALIFQNGDVIKGKWTKKDRESQLQFVDAKGKEVPLVRGLTWISVVAPKTAVTY